MDINQPLVASWVDHDDNRPTADCLSGMKVVRWFYRRYEASDEAEHIDECEYCRSAVEQVAGTLTAIDEEEERQRAASATS